MTALIRRCLAVSFTSDPRMPRFPATRKWLEQLLHTHDTPRRTAIAYAVGVFFGFSPMLGLHTVLGLIVAFAFNLNRVAVLLGIYSNVPWILPAYYSLHAWLYKKNPSGLLAPWNPQVSCK